MNGRPAIRPERLLERLDRFAAIGATPRRGVDRQALSEGDRKARALLADLGRARGFSLRQDGAADLFLRREGTNPTLPRSSSAAISTPSRPAALLEATLSLADPGAAA